MEILCDWNSFVAFDAGEVQATCAISSVVDLQNLLGTTLHVVLRVVFNLKTKPTPSSRLHSSKPKSQTRTLTLSLHRCRPCRLSCPTLLTTTPCSRQDHLRLGCSRVARQQQYEGLLKSLVGWWLKLIGFKIFSTHWSCEGSSNTRSLSAQLKSWLNYKAYIALQVFRLIVLSCCWVLLY